MSALTPSRGRVFELDALRGLALFLMVLHHLIFDLRYLLALDVFAFQESAWFIHLLQPFFLAVFLVVSGISCTFSRSNRRRGLRLLALALALTAVTLVLSSWAALDLVIYWNILHVLAVGILLFAGLTAGRKETDERAATVDAWLILLTVAPIWAGSLLPVLHQAGWNSWWLLPVGLVPEQAANMADYLPLIPWLGFFFAGTLLGRRLYASRTTRFPGAPAWLLATTRPLAWMGRHSLAIYVLHQPLLLALLLGLRALGLL